MKKEPKDGGPAFPAVVKFDSRAVQVARTKGMSLRDAASLQVLGNLTDDQYSAHGPEELAKYCWRMADAWLAERETT